MPEQLLPTSASPVTPQMNPKSNSRSRGNRKRSIKNSSGRGKKFAKKPSAKLVPAAPPVYLYLSACCNIQATKPIACAKTDVENPETHKIKAIAQGLGKWFCPACGKHNVKVSRVKAEPIDRCKNTEVPIDS